MSAVAHLAFERDRRRRLEVLALFLRANGEVKARRLALTSEQYSQCGQALDAALLAYFAGELDTCQWTSEVVLEFLSEQAA